jgi:nucleoside-diphosphate-sugar epimerase
MSADLTDLKDRQVLVIGGTGFVGSRLVAKLAVDCGARVRVLVRNFAKATRIGRYPIEMVSGDIGKPEDLNRALDGCEVLFHCAYGNSGDAKAQRLVTVGGTENVLAAAARFSIKRIVYVSTLSVYGIPDDGDLDETTPRRYAGGLYADSKLDAENVAHDFIRNRRSPLVILQPTVIFGPYGPLWTVDVLRKLKTTGILMIDEGSGFCNAVFIDDVVDAIILAATKDVVGETFLISAEQPVTWRSFYAAYEKMLAQPNTISMSPAEAQSFYNSQRKERRLSRELLKIFRQETIIRERILTTPEAQILLRTTRKAIPQSWWRLLKKVANTETIVAWPSWVDTDCFPAPDAVHPLDIKLNSTKTWVRIDKAKQLLGYHPKFDLEAGMRVTEEWARWANLLPH